MKQKACLVDDHARFFCAQNSEKALGKGENANKKCEY